MKLLFTILFLTSFNATAQSPSFEPLPIEERYKFTAPAYKEVLSDAPFRTGPHSESRVFATIPKGKTVKLTGRDVGFYRAIYEGSAGFVHFAFVDGDYKAFKAAKYPHGPQVFAIDYENEPDSIIIYGKVKFESPLKEDPLSSSKTIYSIPEGTVLKITKYNSAYWQAECEGHIGYLAKPYVMSTGKTPAETEQNAKPPVETISDTDYLTAKYGLSTSRTKTTKQSRTKPVVTQYYIRGPRGGCYYVTASGRKQYVDRSLCD